MLSTERALLSRLHASKERGQISSIDLPSFILDSRKDAAQRIPTPTSLHTLCSNSRKSVTCSSTVFAGLLLALIVIMIDLLVQSSLV